MGLSERRGPSDEAHLPIALAVLGDYGRLGAGAEIKPLPAGDAHWMVTRFQGESGKKIQIRRMQGCGNHGPAAGVSGNERAKGMMQFSIANNARAAAASLAALALAAGVAGCKVHVDKGANGEDKTVQVETPFGGVHVNTDQTTAADLGLPVYPGAEVIKGDDNHKSADVHMGFGEWELRVRAVSYGTPDKRDQVVVFYKKALGRYGDVITCQGKAPVGTPTVTSEGLTCDDDKHGQGKTDAVEIQAGNGDFELKAGSVRHQHIVGFEDTKDGQTRFELVALDLPTGFDGYGKSD